MSSQSPADPTEPTEPTEPTDPVDPDVDLRDPTQHRELQHHPLLLLAVALGGVIGAEARYAISRWVPHPAGRWPWSTLLINLAGCLVIGALMTALAHPSPRQWLIRPFFGTGLLGGFTTFSTYALDLRTMGGDGHLASATVYGLATIVGCLVAVYAGVAGTRAVLARVVVRRSSGTAR